MAIGVVIIANSLQMGLVSTYELRNLDPKYQNEQDTSFTVLSLMEHCFLGSWLPVEDVELTVTSAILRYPSKK